MNKKGFTLVEFAVSFCLIAAVALLLFELILSIKTLYLNGNIKTTLLSKQGIMLQRIYDDFNKNTLKNVSSCGLSCLTFTYISDNSETITTTLEIDPYNTSITYDDYTIKLENGSYIGQVEVTYSTITNITNANINNSLLTINIPVYNNLIDGNYGLNINFPYQSSVTSVNNQIAASDISISLDGMRIPLTTINNVEGTFAEIFYHDVGTTQELFTNYDDLKRSELTNKRSALFAMELFKGKYKTNLNTDVYELILMYPSYSNTEKNHWYQSNNFLKNRISDYNPISIAWNNKWDTYGHFNGLNKITDNYECGFINSNDVENSNCYTTIGAKKLNNGKFTFNQDGTNLTATSIRLLVRCDEYIKKYALSKVIK